MSQRKRSHSKTSGSRRSSTRSSSFRGLDIAKSLPEKHEKASSPVRSDTEQERQCKLQKEATSAQMEMETRAKKLIEEGTSAAQFLFAKEMVPWSMAHRRLVPPPTEEFDLDSAVAHVEPTVCISTQLGDSPLVAAPSEAFRRNPQPKVFLAVDDLWHYAIYGALFEQMGCIVEGTRDLLRAPQLVAPRERPIDRPNKYDFVLYEKTKSTSPETSIADFLYSVKESDIQYRRKTNFATKNTIIHAVGAHENGTISLVKGADLFLRRPLVPHLQTLRSIVLPPHLRSHQRCRVFNRHAGYRRLIGMIEEQEDDFVIKRAVAKLPESSTDLLHLPPLFSPKEETQPKAIQEGLSTEDGDVIPVCKDHLDEEEEKYLKRSIQLRDKDIERLRTELGLAKDEVSQHALRTREYRTNFEELERKYRTETEFLKHEVKSLTEKNDFLLFRLDKFEVAERTRSAAVKDSKELQESQEALHKAQVRIQHLVSELEKERRMNLHQTQKRNVARHTSQKDVAIQAGSGVTMFYNNRRDGSVQCEIVTPEMLLKAKSAQQEAARLVEEMVKADEKQALERRLSRSMSMRRGSQSGSLGASRMSFFAGDADSERVTKRAHAYLQTAEVESLNLRVRSLEKAVETARGRVTAQNAEILQKQVEVETLKLRNDELRQLFSTVESKDSEREDEESLSAIAQRLVHVLHRVETLEEEKKEAVDELTSIKDSFEQTKAENQALQQSNRLYRIVVAVAKLRYSVAVEKNPFVTPMAGALGSNKTTPGAQHVKGDSQTTAVFPPDTFGTEQYTEPSDGVPTATVNPELLKTPQSDAQERTAAGGEFGEHMIPLSQMQYVSSVPVTPRKEGDQQDDQDHSQSDGTSSAEESSQDSGVQEESRQRSLPTHKVVPFG